MPDTEALDPQQAQTQDSALPEQPVRPPSSPVQSNPIDQSEEARQKAIADFMAKNSSATDGMESAVLKQQAQTSAIPSYATPAGYDLGHVVSEIAEDKKPAVIAVISNLFFLITFTYSTLAMLLVAILIALTIALANAGSPGFMYLRYYPKVGVLPIFSALAAMVFLYVAYKLRDGSRQSWIMAVIALATLPVTFSVGMPVLSYPLVKLVSVYAGTPEKPLITPGITLHQLGQIFSVFLAFDLLLIALLVTIKYFRHTPMALSVNAKTSLVVLFLLFVIPTTAIAGYGYWNADRADFGFTQVSDSVSFQVYFSRDIPGGRVLATRYQTGEELANTFNAVKVVYDIPLPTVMQTGRNAPIIVKQVGVGEDFSLDKFVSNRERDAGTQIEAVTISTAADGSGRIVHRGSRVSLFTVLPGSVFIEAISDTATYDELIALINTFE